MDVIVDEMHDIKLKWWPFSCFTWTDKNCNPWNQRKKNKQNIWSEKNHNRSVYQSTYVQFSVFLNESTTTFHEARQEKKKNPCHYSSNTPTYLPYSFRYLTFQHQFSKNLILQHMQCDLKLSQASTYYEHIFGHCAISIDIATWRIVQSKTNLELALLY